jgi:hypothetical protein
VLLAGCVAPPKSVVAAAPLTDCVSSPPDSPMTSVSDAASPVNVIVLLPALNAGVMLAPAVAGSASPAVAATATKAAALRYVRVGVMTPRDAG